MQNSIPFLILNHLDHSNPILHVAAKLPLVNSLFTILKPPVFLDTAFPTSKVIPPTEVVKQVVFLIQCK